MAEWFEGGVPEAIVAAKKKGGILIIYLAGDDAGSTECDQIWATAEIQARMKAARFIGLRLVQGSTDAQNFAAFKAVIAVPSIFFIDAATGAVVNTLEGSHAANPNELCEALISLGEAPGAGRAAEPATAPESNPQPASAPGSSNPHAPVSKKEQARQKVLELQRKMKEKRMQKVDDVKKARREEEFVRRKDAQDMAKAKREREDLEAKRRGEDAIEAAREARAARKFALGNGAAKEPDAEAAGPAVMKKRRGAEPPSAAVAAPPTKKAHTDCRLAFRFPSGKTIKCTFAAEKKLEAAREFVAASPEYKELGHAGEFLLKNSWPHAVLNEWQR